MDEYTTRRRACRRRALAVISRGFTYSLKFLLARRLLYFGVMRAGTWQEHTGPGSVARPLERKETACQLSRENNCPKVCGSEARPLHARVGRGADLPPFHPRLGGPPPSWRAAPADRRELALHPRHPPPPWPSPSRPRTSSANCSAACPPPRRSAVVRTWDLVQGQAGPPRHVQQPQLHRASPSKASTRRPSRNCSTASSSRCAPATTAIAASVAAASGTAAVRSAAALIFGNPVGNDKFSFSSSAAITSPSAPDGNSREGARLRRGRCPTGHSRDYGAAICSSIRRASRAYAAARTARSRPRPSSRRATPASRPARFASRPARRDRPYGIRTRT